MAVIPALDSACHHALTLIGLMCYSFLPAVEGFKVHSALMSAGKVSSSLSFFRVPRFQKDNSNLFDNRQVWGG